MSGFIEDAKRMGDAFADWVKEKHPKFITKNKEKFNPTLYPELIKLFYEYSKELSEESKKNE